MGRGRTTTGMVIACLLHVIRNPHSLKLYDTAIVQQYDNNGAPLMSTDADQMRTRLLAGEYKLIQSLLQVLERGQEAKLLLDAVIDRCSQIQNLRTAIFDYHQRGDAAAAGIGLNYLLRYYFLIVFTAFLLEIDCRGKTLEQSFVTWISERKEINNMIARRELIEFS